MIDSRCQMPQTAKKNLYDENLKARETPQTTTNTLKSKEQKWKQGTMYFSHQNLKIATC